MPPLVSVAMISYNHRPYVSHAIHSALNQQCDFDFEIVISDDRSPDGTATVIDEFEAKHPQRIRRLDPPQNVGMYANFDRVWQACTGKYIALLEGDDFWTDPSKLAKQVARMESDTGLVVSGHTVSTLLSNGESGADSPANAEAIPARGTTVDLLKLGNYLPTCSTMYRRGIVSAVPKWIYETGCVDYLLLLAHSLKGGVGFLDNRMACYRLHAGGAWSSTATLQQIRKDLLGLTRFASNTPDQSDIIRKAISERQTFLLDYLRDEAYEARCRGETKLALSLHRELIRQRLNTRDCVYAAKTLASLMIPHRRNRT